MTYLAINKLFMTAYKLKIKIDVIFGIKEQKNHYFNDLFLLKHQILYCLFKISCGIPIHIGIRLP